MDNKTLITTTEDVFDESGDTNLMIPEGTELRVLSDEIDYVIAETLDKTTSIGLYPNQFLYNQRDPKIFRS